MRTIRRCSDNAALRELKASDEVTGTVDDMTNPTTSTDTHVTSVQHTDALQYTETPVAPVLYLDARKVRAGAAVSNAVLLAAAALYLSTPAAGAGVLAAQSVVFLLARRSPGRHPYRAAIRYIAPLFPAGEPEHPLPVRFAAAVGATFTLAALAAAAAAAAPLVLALTLGCAFAAGLNAYADLCLACLAYPRLRLLAARLTR